MPSIEVKRKLKTLAIRNPFLKYGFAWISALGFDIVKFIDAVRGFPFVIKDYFVLKRSNKSSEKPWVLRMTMPCLEDKYAASGVASGHYFHQDMLVARRIYERNPKKHVDVGSRIDGFVAHVATFRKIEVIDIRYLTSKVPNISFKQLDLMDPVIDNLNYCDSLSCLHALEHFGLGRYGDPLDIQGHLKGFENLSKILQYNGILYLSVPIGKQRIDFNAYRVFNIDTVLTMAKSQFELIGFSYVDDLGDLHENKNLGDQERELNCGCHYGCGIFELRKIK
jgi:hypothetical protein